MPQKPRFLRIPVTLAMLASSGSAQTVYVSRMWHNHQPTYWPEWNSNGSQTNRVEFTWDSIVLKPGRSYPGSTAQHPENPKDRFERQPQTYRLLNEPWSSRGCRPTPCAF